LRRARDRQRLCGLADDVVQAVARDGFIDRLIFDLGLAGGLTGGPGAPAADGGFAVAAEIVRPVQARGFALDLGVVGGALAGGTAFRRLAAAEVQEAGGAATGRPIVWARGVSAETAPAVNDRTVARTGATKVAKAKVFCMARSGGKRRR
jgi:hypothetical protein